MRMKHMTDYEVRKRMKMSKNHTTRLQARNELQLRKKDRKEGQRNKRAIQAQKNNDLFGGAFNNLGY